MSMDDTRRVQMAVARAVAAIRLHTGVTVDTYTHVIGKCVRVYADTGPRVMIPFETVLNAPSTDWLAGQIAALTGVERIGA